MTATSTNALGVIPSGAGADDLGLAAHRRAGVTVMAGLGIAIFGWGLLAHISGAVIAPGRVTVESSVKRIQHREGGIVGDVLVHEGDRVAAGQTLVRLDATVAAANAANAGSQDAELQARRLRLEAERDGLARIAPPAGADPVLAVALRAEQALLTTRLTEREQKKAQLREQANQASQQIEGLQAQVASQQDQFTLIQGELKGIRDLYAKGLSPLSRVNALEREGKRLEGERGQLVSEIARTRAHIAEIRVQLLQVDTDHLQEVMSDLKDTNLRLGQVQDQKVTSDDQLHRLEVRAPVAGRVQQLALHTRGGVIAPGETLMLIVPQDDQLVVEARVDPQHIEQVKAGAPAQIRMTGFQGPATPEITGRVALVGADAQADEKTGASFFVVRCVFSTTALIPAMRAGLIPGMPAEVHIQTRSRNALSYFLKPLSDQMARTFREE
ncbi:HlyD family type I secretion periplasmic adaptor subunit [Caulobacter sp. KR2-114]|uniref:HlyD family type I secretion periplasmic adaptor subunit n=1 Tax=Caulobacter sp. KR2-114 TaxID=3400912 RepID=UPI003C100C7C